MALGVIGRPELLFLDEPTTGFDPEARIEFWELIHALSAEGTTILLTTHYLEEAEALADRVGVIAAGRLLEVATPATLGGRDTRRHDRQLGRCRPGGSRSRPTPRPRPCEKLAGELGGEIPGLNVARPTLEDIYLRMIDKGKGTD